MSDRRPDNLEQPPSKRRRKHYNGYDAFGNPRPLALQIQRNTRLEEVREMLAAGFDMEARSQRSPTGSTALLKALSEQNIPVARYLFERGADLSAYTSCGEGDTIMHFGTILKCSILTRKVTKHRSDRVYFEVQDDELVFDFVRCGACEQLSNLTPGQKQLISGYVDRINLRRDAIQEVLRGKLRKLPVDVAEVIMNYFSVKYADLTKLKTHPLRRSTRLARKRRAARRRFLEAAYPSSSESEDEEEEEEESQEEESSAEEEEEEESEEEEEQESEDSAMEQSEVESGSEEESGCEEEEESDVGSEEDSMMCSAEEQEEEDESNDEEESGSEEEDSDMQEEESGFDEESEYDSELSDSEL